MEKFSLLGIIVANISLIIGFAIGKIALYKAENAVKFFAYFSILMCTAFILYFASILGYSVCSLYNGHLIQAMAFPIFIFMPFVIGHFTSYEKVQLFTNIQILTLIISLALALYFV